MILSILAAAAVALSGFSPMSDPAAFRKALAEKTSSEKTIDSRFTQTKYLSVFSDKVVSEGRFCYEDGNIAMLYDNGYQIVIVGTKMKTTSGGKTSVANLGGNPMMSQVKTLLQACMTGDLSSLSQTCSLEYKESPEEYLVLVHPESETFKAYVSSMEIYFDRKDFSVSRLVMHEKGSDYTQYDFTSKKFNTKIDEKIFSLH